MGLIRKLALAILTLTLFTFIALFGRLPAFRNTPVGFLNRLLCIHIPKRGRAVDERITGGRVTSSTSKFGHYLLREKHPLVLIFFLGLVTSAATIFLIPVWPRLTLLHHISIPVLLPLPYLFTYLCATSIASEITPSNHTRELERYPFDYTLYHPDIICQTCHFEKPARSKHCSICKRCVAKSDHHCAWVNNCLGRDNYRWFLALLLSLGSVLVYGALLARGQIVQHVPPAHLWEGKQGLRGVVERWSFSAKRDVGVGAVGMLAAFTAPLCWGLLAYHVYLIWAGTTTNENNKWSVLREEMADGYVLIGKRSEVLAPKRGRPSRIESTVGPVWPIETDQILMRIADREAPDRGQDQHAWELCWQLGQVSNLYDLGFWDNVRDALCFDVYLS